MPARQRPPISTSEVTTIGAVLPALAATLDARGIDPHAVFAAGGVVYRDVTGPLDRVTVATLERIWAAAVESTRDPLIGLEVGQRLRPNSWHALGFSLQASRSLRDFGERLARYFRFVAEASSMSFAEREEDVVIVGRPLIDRLPPESEDTFIVFVVRFLADLSEGAIRPSAVALIRERPQDGGVRHERLLGCPVVFGAPSNEIHFPRRIADVPFPGGSEELAQVNDQVVIAYLAKLDRSDVVARVRSLVIDDLPTGRISKSRIASRLNMSPRTLQYKLERQNTTFQQLVDETRQSLARGYVEDRSRSLKEIAYLLGFSSPSNLSRAFKRWTGVAPGGNRDAAAP